MTTSFLWLPLLSSHGSREDVPFSPVCAWYAVEKLKNRCYQTFPSKSIYTGQSLSAPLPTVHFQDVTDTLHEIANLSPPAMEAGKCCISFQSLGAAGGGGGGDSCTAHHLSNQMASPALTRPLYFCHRGFLLSTSSGPIPAAIRGRTALPQVHSHKDSPAALRQGCGGACPETTFTSKLTQETCSLAGK